MKLNMGYLTAKDFSKIWGISERRIIKLCKENRISGAKKSGMAWKIPEETLKPSDKRSNIYKYINIPKRVMVINAKTEIKENLMELLEKEGYIVDYKEFEKIDSNIDITQKYYDGLIYFPINNVDKKEEKFIVDFSKKLHSESSIVIVDYKNSKRNKIEEKLSDRFKKEIGFKINTLILDIPQDKDVLVNYNEIAEDIFELLVKFKNTTGIAITTDGGKIEFDKNGRTENLETGVYYKVINQYFKKLNQNSYLWCASTMLEDEWTEDPIEVNFRILNLEIANRGIKIDRVFIFSKNKIKEFKNNKTLKIYMQSNINTMFVDYDEIKEANPKLLKKVGNGWDGIDTETLIIDLPDNNEKRGYISKNNKDVQKAYECFQELMKYAKDLKEILK
jgi:ribosomal protein S8